MWAYIVKVYDLWWELFWELPLVGKVWLIMATTYPLTITLVIIFS